MDKRAKQRNVRKTEGWRTISETVETEGNKSKKKKMTTMSETE